jgi:hypothetical protein
MPINTTRGVVTEVPRGTRESTGHTLNTTRILEEDLTYVDESPEIIAVLPGTGWQAVIGGEGIPLVAWVALDDASMYGVTLGADGRIDLNADVENNPNFVRYARGATER